MPSAICETTDRPGVAQLESFSKGTCTPHKGVLCLSLTPSLPGLSQYRSLSSLKSQLTFSLIGPKNFAVPQSAKSKWIRRGIEYRLDDTDDMPFGKYKGSAMMSVPPDYLNWLWLNGVCADELSPVCEYIRRNLRYLKRQRPDLIWTDNSK